uniref:Putative pectate lyase n=1 Tax=viral metagenome TaxID=1070528 RepID=A0A6M3XS05_9ZZZZ
MKHLRLFVIILAALFVSCGTSFATIKWTNNASSILAAGISAGATSITVTTGDGDEFPAVAAPHYFMLTLVDSAGRREIVKCTARVALSDTMTIVRAQESTTARAYVTGDAVSLRVTQSSLDFFSKSVDANAHIYIADPSETDQGAVGSGGSIKDLLNSIGTTKRATIVLPQLSENGYTTTTYTLGTALDASSYTAVTLLIQPGAKLDCVTSSFTWGGNTIPLGENAFGNDTGYTITLQTVDAGNYRIFDNLSGNAVINKSMIQAEWFGVGTAVSGANNSAYFIKAAASIPSSGGDLALSSPGSYSVSGEISINKSNVSVNFGDGVLINGIAGAANFIKIIGVQGSHISNIKISNLNFDGNSVSGYPITVAYADDVLISDCRIDRAALSGIAISSFAADTDYVAKRPKIIRTKATRCGIYGIQVSGTLDLEIANSYSYSNTYDNYWVENSYNFNVHDNVSSESGRSGFYFSSDVVWVKPSGRIVNNSDFESIHNSFYVLMEAASVGISGLVVSNNESYTPTLSSFKFYGDGTDYIDYLTATGNISYGAGLNGVEAYFLNYPNFTGNIVKTSTADAFCLTANVSYGTFTGNISRDFGSAGDSHDAGFEWGVNCNYNIFTGNSIYAGTNSNHGFYAHSSPAGSAYNQMEANKFIGFSDGLQYSLKGNQTVIDTARAESISTTTTSGTGEQNLHNMTLGADELGLNGGLTITAAGDATGDNGTKTVKICIGTQCITALSSVSGYSEWRIEADIYAASATNNQQASWESHWETDSYSGHDALAADTTIANTVKVTGECQNAADTIINYMFIVRRKR